jgi:alpha-tubulin suppressor-like RCC1 family protein
VAGNRTFARVLAGRLHTCALTAEGDALCWGDNGLGQLADGSNTNRATPVPVGGGGRFRSLALGGAHACGLDEAGALRCWGTNAQGQLGVPSPDRCSVFGVDEPCAKRPTLVPLPGASALTHIATGENHTCALGEDGRAWCWGRNDWGQLGIGRFGGSAGEPTEVLGGLRFRDIAAGPTNTCALDETGAAWCWGMVARGVLGMDTLTANRDRPSPVTMPAGVAFLEIGVGDAHACARAEGGVWCWGAVAGNASAAPARVPARVGDAFAPATLSVGGSHTCAYAAGVWCWGANTYGQLGVPKDSVAVAPAPLLVRRSPPQ